MGKQLKYSVLRYSPSTVSGEAINLGILFAEEDTGFRDFVYIKKFARLSKFDDTVPILKVKEFLKGIKEDIEPTIFNQNFNIDQYTKYYINDYYFDRPKTIEYSVLEDAVLRIHKTYLRFDFPISDRPTKDDDKKLISEILKAKGIDTERRGVVTGAFDDNITFDFLTDQYCIKLFDFDSKDLSRVVDTAKTWAWNCKFSVENNRKTMILYRFCFDESAEINRQYFDVISKIFLKSGTKFIELEQGVDLLQNL